MENYPACVLCDTRVSNACCSRYLGNCELPPCITALKSKVAAIANQMKEEYVKDGGIKPIWYIMALETIAKEG